MEEEREGGCMRIMVVYHNGYVPEHVEAVIKMLIEHERVTVGKTIECAIIPTPSHDLSVRLTRTECGCYTVEMVPIKKSVFTGDYAWEVIHR